jgi:ankyrin repeat protein
MLVKSGADANLPMGDGQTAVHVAAVGGNLAVLRVLLQNGGDAQIADKEGETALHKVKSFSFLYGSNYLFLFILHSQNECYFALMRPIQPPPTIPYILRIFFAAIWPEFMY